MHYSGTEMCAFACSMCVHYSETVLCAFLKKGVQKCVHFNEIPIAKKVSSDSCKESRLAAHGHAIGSGMGRQGRKG